MFWNFSKKSFYKNESTLKTFHFSYVRNKLENMFISFIHALLLCCIIIEAGLKTQATITWNSC